VAQTMTPSAIATDEQFGKVSEILTAGLRKAKLQREPLQTVLKDQGKQLVSELVAAIRRRVEAVSNLIIRTVEKVNRTRTGAEALKATGRNVYGNDKVIEAMPRGKGEDAEITFLKPDLSERGGYITDDDLEKWARDLGYTFADPFSLTAVNEEDPAFADEKPNATHWKDAEGKWCFAAFDRWGDGRCVRVHRHDRVWGDDWSFALVRK